MKVYTSYYGNIKNLRQNDITPVGISYAIPQSMAGILAVPELAPTYFMTTARCSHVMFLRMYADILSKLDAKTVMRRLTQYGHVEGDIAMCCFERPEAFCHRHLAAKWLSEQLGIEITEYPTFKESEKQKRVDTQLSLF